jgi:hypothetical protein
MITLLPLGTRGPRKGSVFYLYESDERIPPYFALLKYREVVVMFKF